MRYSRVYLDAIAPHMAPEVVTTRALEERLAPVYAELRIQPGQVEALTGIRERRFWPAGASVADGAAQAALAALRASNVPPEAVEALVYGSVCRAEHEPATACHVAAALEEAGWGISPRAEIFDVSNACLGLLQGVIEVANRVELGQIRAGLVVGCESARDIVDATIYRLNTTRDIDHFRHLLATLTGGSGAAAILVTDGSFTSRPRRRLLGGVHRSAPRHHMLCRWGTEPDPDHTPRAPGDTRLRPFMTTDSVAVLEHGVRLGAETWADLLDTLDLDADAIDRVISHQVGARHRDTILRTLGLPPSRDFVAYTHLGNTGSVAIPLAAALAERQGFLSPGQRVALLGIGSGLNCMMLAVQW